MVDNGEEAIQEVFRLNPNILVLDITMPGLNGIQVACHLRDSHAKTKVLFLTINEQPEYIVAAFSAGARGYVSKRHLATDLATAIREVFAGQTFVSPSLRNRKGQPDRGSTVIVTDLAGFRRYVFTPSICDVRWPCCYERARSGDGFVDFDSAFTSRPEWTSFSIAIPTFRWNC